MNDAGVSARVLKRFFAKVEKIPGGCWLWHGSRTEKGYGLFGPCKAFPGRRAHRIAYHLFVGSIPDGLFVCHNCPGGDNPSCVNPEHLFLGTNSDNIRDAYKKGRIIFPNTEAVHQNNLARRGAGSEFAKLSDAQSVEIRERYSRGETNYGALGRDYRVTGSTIRRIVLGRTFKNTL